MAIGAKGWGVVVERPQRELRVEFAYTTDQARRMALWHSRAGLVPRDHLGAYHSRLPLNSAEKHGWNILRRQNGAKVTRVVVVVTTR